MCENYLQIFGRIISVEFTPWGTKTGIETDKKNTYTIIEFDGADWIYPSQIGYHQLMILGSVMIFQNI